MAELERIAGVSGSAQAQDSMVPIGVKAAAFGFCFCLHINRICRFRRSLAIH